MDISLFLAQAFGLYFVLAGTAVLIRPASMLNLTQLFTNRNVTFLSGFLSLLVGIPLVLLHTVWDGSWRVIITILAWLALGKGLVRIFFPGPVANWIGALVTYPLVARYLLWIVVILGIYLIYLGFGWSQYML